MIRNQQVYPSELLDPLIIELGNKNTRVWFSYAFISFPSTLTFPSSQSEQDITIGNHPFVTTLSQTSDFNTNNSNSSLIFYDLISILGRKYVQPSFQKEIKYFPCDFAQGRDQQIQPMLPKSDANVVLGWCVKKHCPVEFLIAVIIRSAVEWAMKIQRDGSGKDNRHLFEFARRHKVIIVANDNIFHSQKLAISNVLKIALSEPSLSSKIQALTQFQFLIVKSTSALALDFYATNIHSPEPLITQTGSLPICLIDFSDRSFSLSITALSSSTSTLNTLHLQSNLNGGGQILTRLLVQQVLNVLWKERGLDIKKNCLLMAQLVIECQNAKITLSRQKQAFVRVEGLPDEKKDFGYPITRQKFQDIIKSILESNIALVKKALLKENQEKQTEKQKQTQSQYKSFEKSNTHSKIIKTNEFSSTTYALHQRKVCTFLISGGSSQIPLFRKTFLQQIPNERVIWVQQQSAVRGASYLNRPLPSQESTSLKIHPILFDRSSTTLYLQPQQQPLSVLILQNDYIPTRRNYNLRFPPGNLTFRLRVFECQRKVAEYIVVDNLQSENYYFTLTFQMNRNGLFKLYGNTKKGKIKMIEDLRGLNQEEVKLGITNIQRIKTDLSKNNYYQQEWYNDSLKSPILKKRQPNQQNFIINLLTIQQIYIDTFFRPNLSKVDMSKSRLKLQVSHEKHEKKNVQQQSQHTTISDKSGAKLTSNNKNDTKSKANADEHLSLIGQQPVKGKDTIKDTGKEKELTKGKGKAKDEINSEVKGKTKDKETQNNEKMSKIPIKQSQTNPVMSDVNQSYLNTIDNINKSQQKVKLTIQELILQYKDSSDDIFTNHGHNPQKQAEINNRLSRLQKQKQERALKLEKSYQLQDLKRQLKQQKEEQKVEKRINRMKTKIKARAQSKLQQLQRSAAERQRNHLQFLQHYQQHRNKQFRFQKYSSQQAQRLKQEQLQLKLKLKMIHNRYSPIDHTSLNDFQEEYEHQKWGHFEENERKREFQIRVVEEQNNKIRGKLWRGKCHKSVEMQIEYQKEKTKDRKKVQEKRKDYATSVKTSMMPKSVRQSTMSSAIAAIQNQIVGKEKSQGDAASQSLSEKEPKSSSKQKKVIAYRFFQGKNQGPFIEKRKVPLSNSEKLQKGNQYLQHLHNLPKKAPSTLEPTAPVEPSPSSIKHEIVKIRKQSNPYYINATRNFGGSSIRNREAFDYNMAKLNKVDKSIDLQEKVIRFGSYSGVLELQRKKNAYTRNVAQNLARKLDMLSNI